MGVARIVPASQFTLPELVEAFNRGFEGYAVPITQSVESLAAMIEGNDVSLPDSVVALDQAGEPAGIGLLGVRPPDGWVAGMGIATELRGAGHGGALLAALIARCRELGLRQLQLEVLEQNEPAYRLYTRMGFVDERPLLVFSGPLASAPTSASTPAPEPPNVPTAPADAGSPITPIEPAAALAQFAPLHRVPAPWQRDLASLRVGLSRLSGLGMVAEDGTTLRAALLFRPVPGGIVVLDAGSTAPTAAERAAQVVALLRALVARQPDMPVRAVNVAPGDPLGDALTQLRCPVVLRQREMALDLSSPS